MKQPPPPEMTLEEAKARILKLEGVLKTIITQNYTVPRQLAEKALETTLERSS